jgi:hypothetical protein
MGKDKGAEALFTMSGVMTYIWPENLFKEVDQ